MTADTIVVDTGQVDALGEAALILVSDADDLMVVDEANVDEASEMLVRCTAYTRDAEELRKQLTKPLLDHKTFIDHLFKTKVKPVVELQTALRGAIGAFRTRQEEERREREREAREALAKADVERRKRDEELARAVGVDPDMMPTTTLADADIVVPPIESKVDVEGGSVTVRPVVKFEVTNANLVPRRFCVPDEKAIRKYVTGMVDAVGIDDAQATFARELQGVVVRVEMTTVVTAR